MINGIRVIFFSRLFASVNKNINFYYSIKSESGADFNSFNFSQTKSVYPRLSSNMISPINFKSFLDVYYSSKCIKY